jgi:hypothetical protein
VVPGNPVLVRVVHVEGPRDDVEEGAGVREGTVPVRDAFRDPDEEVLAVARDDDLRPEVRRRFLPDVEEDELRLRRVRTEPDVLLLRW